MNLFVKKTDTINIPVFVWEDSDFVEASATKSDIPKDKESQSCSFTFRLPSHADSTGILRQALSAGKDNLDVSVFQDLVLLNRLVSWDIKENGEAVPVTAITIGELQPSIARAAVGGYLSKVRI